MSDLKIPLNDFYLCSKYKNYEIKKIINNKNLLSTEIILEKQNKGKEECPICFSIPMCGVLFDNCIHWVCSECYKKEYYKILRCPICACLTKDPNNTNLIKKHKHSISEAIKDSCCVIL